MVRGQRNLWHRPRLRGRGESHSQCVHVPGLFHHDRWPFSLYYHPPGMGMVESHARCRQQTNNQEGNIMSQKIPVEIIQQTIDESIKAFMDIKTEINQDEPFYAYVNTGLNPTDPLGGYSVVFFIHSNLKTSNEFQRQVVQWIREHTESETVGERL